MNCVLSTFYGKGELRNVENRVLLNSIFSSNVVYTNYKDCNNCNTTYIRGS